MSLGRRIVIVLLSILMVVGVAQAQEPLPMPPAPETAQAEVRGGNPNNYNCVLALVVGCNDLKVLYNSTGGSAWTNNTGWWEKTGILQTQVGVCDFYGVDCDVLNLLLLTDIRLPGNNLTGTLPSSLTSLLGIADMDFSRNHLSGSIPLNLLGGLVQLREFNLSGNMLTGPLPDQLSSVTGLLGGLDLNYNMVEDTRPLLLDILISTGWINTQTIPPRDLAVSGTGQNSISLDWSAIPYVADGGGYDIRYRVVGSGTWTTAPRTAGKSVEALTISGLLPETAYEFEIRTVTPAHVNNPNTLITEWSKGAGGTTVTGTTGEPAPETPGAPTDVIVDVTGQTSLNVSWLNILGLDYLVQISTDGMNWTTINVGAGASALDILNLQCGTTYQIRVQSILGLLFSLFSQVIEATTEDCSILAPATPTGFSVVANGPTSANATWNSSGDDISYTLQYSENGINWTSINIDEGVTAYTVTGLDCGTTYQFRLSAYSLINLISSPYTNPSLVTTGDCAQTPPSAPSSFNVQSTSPTAVLATWSSAGAGLSYEIWYSSNGVDFSVYTSAVNDTMATIDGLVCGTSYTFRIRSVRTSPAAVSAFSSDVIAATGACAEVAPPAPTGLVAIATGSNSAFAAWSSSGGGVSYTLQYSTDGTNWMSMQIPVDTQSTSVSPLACNTTYTFRVIAKKGQQSSAPSETAMATTGSCSADPVELLINGSFEDGSRMPDNFTNIGTAPVKKKCNPAKAYSGSCALEFKGRAGKLGGLLQKVPGVSGPAGDVFVVSYFVNAKNVEFGSRPTFRVKIKYDNGNRAKLALKANAGTYGYVQFSASFSAARPYTKMLASFLNNSGTGKTYMDGASITRQPVQ